MLRTYVHRKSRLVKCLSLWRVYVTTNQFVSRFVIKTCLVDKYTHFDEQISQNNDVNLSVTLWTGSFEFEKTLWIRKLNKIFLYLSNDSTIRWLFTGCLHIHKTPWASINIYGAAIMYDSFLLILKGLTFIDLNSGLQVLYC